MPRVHLILTNVTFFVLVSMFCTVASAHEEASAVSEKHVLEICSEQKYHADKIACMSAMKENLFDFHALNFCRKQYYDSEKTACYKIIANKQFSNDVLAVCEQQFNDPGKRNCLKAANFRLIQEPNGFSPVSKNLVQALKALENKNYEMAEELIRDLHQRLNP